MKCLSTLNTMKILGNSARGLFSIQKRLLYRTCILPIALYGFQLWFFKSASIVKNLAELRKIQQRAALWITKAFCVSQLCYGPVVTYCMVYHYTKRMMLARLLANKGPAIYVVYLNRYFVIPPWYYLVVTFLWHSICNTKIVLSRNLSTKVINSVPSGVLILTNPLSSVTINPPWRKAPRDSS